MPGLVPEALPEWAEASSAPKAAEPRPARPQVPQTQTRQIIDGALVASHILARNVHVPEEAPTSGFRSPGVGGEPEPSPKVAPRRNPRQRPAARPALAPRSGAALPQAGRAGTPRLERGVVPPSLRTAQRCGAAASGPDARSASRPATTRTSCTRGARPAQRDAADGPLPAVLRGRWRLIQIGEVGDAKRRPPVPYQ